MTQLLVSVKNVEEARVALAAGIDVIDLKDPAIGALGALDKRTIAQILQAIGGHTAVSATIGEGHMRLDQITQDIRIYAGLGVDIVKIGVNPLFYQQDFISEMLSLTTTGIKIVAVFFGDENVDFGLFPLLQGARFYGAMLDTNAKQRPLVEHQSDRVLSMFVDLCVKHDLISGLAGSLKPQHLDKLTQIHPTFVGFRGGVCENDVRESKLSSEKVVYVKNMLYKHNNMVEVGLAGALCIA